MTWTRFEIRWRDALLGAVLPGGGGLPPLAGLDLGDYFRAFDAAAPPFLRLGLRAAVWILTWLPLFGRGFGRAFPRLDAARKDAFLARAAGSRSYLVRQLVLTLRVVACYGYFRDRAIRARYEGAGGA